MEHTTEFKVNGEFVLHFDVLPTVIHVKDTDYARPEMVLQSDQMCSFCGGIRMNPWWYEALTRFMGALPFDLCTCDADMQAQSDTIVVRTLGSE